MMRIEKISIHNFRIFRDVQLNFPDSNAIVFIGNNGKGKTTLLDAIAILLNQFVSKLQNLDKPQPVSPRRYVLKDEDIHLQGQETKLEIRLKRENDAVNWSTQKQRFEKSNGTSKKQNPELEDYLEELKVNIRDIPDFNLPIAVYYATNRILLPGTNYSSEPMKTFRYSQLSAYDGALSRGLSDFGRFVAWFREEEDKENGQMRRERNFDLYNPRLQVIRQAFRIFFENLRSESFSNLRVERDLVERGTEGVMHEKRSALIVSKGSEDFQIEQLSDGERVLMLMVCDIARRLAIANPNPKAGSELQGKGIVLIDELDLHLHPKWQRSILSAFRQTFPNIQFIVTTHSPQILSEIQQEEIFILDRGAVFQAAVNPMGRDTNAILEEIMDTPKRPEEVEQLIAEYLAHLQKDSPQNAHYFKEKLMERLDKGDPVFAKADALFTRKQLLGR